MPVVLGIDSSTQSTKVELRYADDGRLLAAARAPHPPTTPPRSEQHPSAWWSALGDAVADKDTAIVLYCAMGMRSVLAAATLQSLGYTRVAVLHDGLRALRKAAGQPWIDQYPFGDAYEADA